MCTRDLQSKIDTLTEYTLFLNAGVTKLTNDEKGHSSSCTNKPEVEIEECIQIISMIPKSHDSKVLPGTMPFHRM